MTQRPFFIITGEYNNIYHDQTTALPKLFFTCYTILLNFECPYYNSNSLYFVHRVHSFNKYSLFSNFGLSKLLRR